MFRFSVLVLFAALSWAQPAGESPIGKPPAEVDQALRARIKEFNDLVVKQEFRKAEALVAEDTKDFYYNMVKPKLKKLELVRIEYSQDFTHAKAFVNSERTIDAPPFPPGVVLKGQTTDTWKIEGGQWFWYVDQNAPIDVPFTQIRPGVSDPNSPTPGLMPGIPKSADFVLHQVKPEQESIALAAGGSAQVTFANSAPGPMKLIVDEKPAGVEVKIDKPEVPGRQKAVVTLEAGKDAKSGTLRVRVEQTGEVFALPVSVKQP